MAVKGSADETGRQAFQESVGKWKAKEVVVVAWEKEHPKRLQRVAGASRRNGPLGPQYPGQAPDMGGTPPGPDLRSFSADRSTVKAASQHAVEAHSGSPGHASAPSFSVTPRQTPSVEVNRGKGLRGHAGHAERRENVKHSWSQCSALYQLFQRLLEPGRGSVDKRMPWERTLQRNSQFGN